ncbi:MAG: nucleotide-binding protein [Alphaproteobacteria bacterium]|nr:MAG: nucleotide-binding protein [Alphaproteobacteria bacterium]
MLTDIKDGTEILPVKDGLIEFSQEDIGGLHLLGSFCNACNEVSMGTNALCMNCGGKEIKTIRLSRDGVLWSYTIIRHRPPGDYLGEDEFKPFGLGLVELDDGIKIMAPMEGAVDAFHIGMKLVLRPWVLVSKDGQNYLAFRYAEQGELEVKC